MFYRKEKTERIIRDIAAEFIKKESGPQSIITVFDVKFDKKTNKALLFISVLPAEKAKEAKDFIMRKRKDFIEYLKKNSHFKNLPFVEFQISGQ